MYEATYPVEIIIHFQESSHFPLLSLSIIKHGGMVRIFTTCNKYMASNRFTVVFYQTCTHINCYRDFLHLTESIASFFSCIPTIMVGIQGWHFRVDHSLWINQICSNLFCIKINIYNDHQYPFGDIRVITIIQSYCKMNDVFFLWM